MAALLVAVSSPASAQSTPDFSAAPLEGMWRAEVSQPVPHGELVITRHGDSWSATIGDQHPSVTIHDGELSFALAQGQGSLRGALAGREIRGVWTQPPTLSGQAYATPLTLRASGRDTWRGDVAPLDVRFHLYLRVFRDGDGRWLGAFRNPEANFNGGASRFVVSLSGDTVHFGVPGDNAAHDATLLRGPDRLRLHWPPFSDDLELMRATPAQASTFYPRPPGSPAYVYTPPSSIADGWRTARARDVGMDETALAAAVQRIIDVDPSARRPSLTHSLLIARRGRLVLEEYFYGFDRNTPHDVRSAAKTFGSVMLGAAMQRGAHISPETRVYPLLASMGPFANPDARKTRLTLAHLMTESSGLACNDYDENSPGAEGNMQSQSAQPNWWRYILDLPMAHEPGERYAYCSANTNLVGAALRVATDTPVVDYFDRAIARPLLFGPYHWNLMPSGEGYLGGGVQMRPRDLLKIGQLYLNGGVWNGRRIVSRAWTMLSTSALQPITEQSTGLDAETFGNSYTHGADGYAWHRYGVRVGDSMVDEYEANGNGGQLLIVVPEYDLVVVLTGGNFGQGGIWIPWRNDIVGGQIIPAIRR
jgi:CubicO group peptidase (beta-lactamase class C family)